jgi:hypothetical protein
MRERKKNRLRRIEIKSILKENAGFVFRVVLEFASIKKRFNDF